MKFEKMPAKLNLGEVQAKVLKFWEDNKTFEKSVNKASKGEVVFYDGPPFPTGIPHAGTVLVSFIKDLIGRYQTMRGYSVPRRWGWDCHGLPIETKVEELLGINGKDEIETKVGVDKFNEACFNHVSKNNKTWEDYIYNMARWVDYDGSYKTMDLSYMESVIWAFKACYDKGLIYQDYRVTPYCHRCETPLSISETREDDATRPKTDSYVLVKLDSNETLDGKKVYYLAWTTTPWTLPSNMALAVNPALNYVYVEKDDEIYIVGEEAVVNFEKFFKTPKIIKKQTGAELVGKRYTPVMPYFEHKKDEGAFKIIAADFVSSTDGVGIVHIAPAFGEDDYWACKSNSVPLVCPVDEKGNYTAEVSDFFGRNVLEANKDVLIKLRTMGVVLDYGSITHNYPHCWRCKKPLIYKAMKAWYFNIDKIKDKLKEQNENVNWIPSTIKHGRFGNWLDGARDWNISRNRYWSTPIPVWECECGGRKVLGSLDEIEKETGVRLNNLHKQYMDKLTCKCECGKEMHRISEVLDCWFESGCAPFAPLHYPFENKEWFETHCPSDFVVEYTGQIRCWFYYLHVLSVALFDKNAFKNCIVHGTVLDKEGKKMSKSSKNYTDPMKLMKEVGTDAYRMYMFRSAAMGIGDLEFTDSGLNEQMTSLILPLYSATSFLTSYAILDGFEPTSIKEPNSKNPLDNYILAKLYETEEFVRDRLDSYLISGFAEPIFSLVDAITNWYIRRSRRRFWGSEATEDKQNAYETLYYVLVQLCKILAPACPIIADELYKTLSGGESVHLENWPEIPAKYKNEKLLKETAVCQDIIYLARSLRTKNNIKNRQPLSKLSLATSDESVAKIAQDNKDIICDELNVKQLEIVEDAEKISNTIYKPNFAVINANFKDRAGEIIAAIRTKQFKLDKDKVVINGEKLIVDVLLIEYQAKDGMNVASQNGLVINLDVHITDELKNEGYARELVRAIQDARKTANFEISDKIKIEFSTNMPAEWKNYVLVETLGNEEDIIKPLSVVEVETDEKPIIVKLEKK